jgi:hypothetical protein
MEKPRFQQKLSAKITSHATELCNSKADGNSILAGKPLIANVTGSKPKA